MRITFEYIGALQQENKILKNLLSSAFMNTDCTNARVNGESAYVYVCATPDEQKVLYFAREKKGKGA